MKDTNKGNVTREMFQKYIFRFIKDGEKKNAWESFYKMSIEIMEKAYEARNTSEEM